MFTIGGYDEGKLYDRLARTSPLLITVSGKHITSVGLRALGWMCGATLTTLTFERTDADENDQRLCFQRCPLLAAYNLYLPYHNLLLPFAHWCPQLETLTLNGSFLTTAVVTELNSLKHLRSLTLFQPLIFNQLEGGYLTGPSFFNSAASVNLERLALDLAQLLVHDATIQSIARSFPNLNAFSLVNIILDDLSSASIDLLIQSCVYLEEFRVSNRRLKSIISPLSDDTLYELSQHCPFLKRVELDGSFSETALVAFIQATPGLTELVIDILTEMSIEALTGCPKLEKLHATTIIASDASMCRLFQSCRQLSDLSMNKASKATLSCLVHKCLKLTNLKLSGTDDHALSALVWSPRLQSLHLSDPPTPATTGLLAVIKGCTRLRKLTVNTYDQASISGRIPSMYIHVPRHRHYEFVISQYYKSKDTGLSSCRPHIYSEESRQIALKLLSIATITGCTVSVYLLRWSQRALCSLTWKLVELWPYIAQYISSKCSIVYLRHN